MRYSKSKNRFIPFERGEQFQRAALKSCASGESKNKRDRSFSHGLRDRFQFRLLNKKLLENIFQNLKRQDPSLGPLLFVYKISSNFERSKSSKKSKLPCGKSAGRKTVAREVAVILFSS